MIKSLNKVIILCGPTASGKSQLAMLIAGLVNGVIINADSTQIYKEIPILTASPSVQDQADISHKLFNFLPLNQGFNVVTWVKLALNEIKLAFLQNKTPILVGGTGFYLQALLDGLSFIPDISISNKNKAEQVFNDLGQCKFKEMLVQLDPKATGLQDKYRLTRSYEVFLETAKPLSYWHSQPKSNKFNHDYILFKLLPDRESLYTNINSRFNHMINIGGLQEARSIIKNYPGHPLLNLSKSAIGLRELISYLEGEIALNSAVAKACQKTRHYAKRQYTWFNHQLKKEEIITLNTIDTDYIIKIIQSYA